MIETEVRVQTASQDYECDSCGNVIHDETKYVRVSPVRYLGRRPRGLPSAVPGGMEKYHPDCYDKLQEGEIDD